MRASFSSRLESVCKHLPTSHLHSTFQQFIGSILCKCCHVVINLSCPTVVQWQYRSLHGCRSRAFYRLQPNKAINTLRQFRNVNWQKLSIAMDRNIFSHPNIRWQLNRRHFIINDYAMWQTRVPRKIQHWMNKLISKQKLPPSPLHIETHGRWSCNKY